MTVYADSKTNITQNGTGSGSVINQQEEPQISTVNSNTTDNTNSSDDQTSQKPVTNTEAQQKDNNNQDGIRHGIRPSSITVNLLANGKKIESKTVTASDNWQYSWDNLPAYAHGKKIIYTVTENPVAGYTSTVDGYNITNTLNTLLKPKTPKPQVPNQPTTPKKPQVPNTTTPKKPQVPNNGNKVTPKAYTQGKTYEKTGKLPQTDDKSSMGMMLIGLVTLLLSLGLAVISRFTI